MKNVMRVLFAVVLMAAVSAPALASTIASEPPYTPARLLPMKDSDNTRTARLLPDRSGSRQGDNLLPDRDHSRQGDR